ncbi:MAG: PIN domain-containing protein [Actinobacteria bacterium]|nr:PIN domain-containing protein [Actinomycetota bacterium]
MITVADTSGLLALFNDSEPAHPRIRTHVDRLDSPLVVSPFVLAELDYLLAKRLGPATEIQVMEELSGGAYDLASLDHTDLANCVSIISRYQDQRIGLTDASLVVLADRHQTDSVLTLDRRHFTVMTPLRGGHFLLP